MHLEHSKVANEYALFHTNTARRLLSIPVTPLPARPDGRKGIEASFPRQFDDCMTKAIVPNRMWCLMTKVRNTSNTRLVATVFLFLMTISGKPCVSHSAPVMKIPAPGEQARAMARSTPSSDNIFKATEEMASQEAIKSGRPYIIIDKPTATVHFFTQSGNQVGQSPVLLGKSFGDFLNQEQARKSIQEMGDGDKITPSGHFNILHFSQNYGGTSAAFVSAEGGNIALHPTATNGDLIRENRPERYGLVARQRRISYGCVNYSAGVWKRFAAGRYRVGDAIYVTPDDPRNGILLYGR